MLDTPNLIRRLVVMAMLSTAVFSAVASSFAQDASASTAIATSDAQSTAIVAAADVFLASLSAEQKAAAVFAFNDAAQRTRWSNFPLGLFTRQGVKWGDLSADQQAALTKLLGTVLSPTGLTMVQEQMAADDQLAQQPTGVGGPGGKLIFGSAYYYVSFLGEPSTTAPWMLQFGGHHLAINATVVGPDLTLSPTLTGGQPIKFTVDGKQIYIVEQEVTEATALLNSLNQEQKTKAVRGTQSIDLVLGPGKDGMTLQPEGIAGSDLTDAQKAQLLKLIEARLDILNADDLAATMAPIEAAIDQTYFAWFGSTTETGAAYWRVTGPNLLLEFSPQSLGGDPSNHLHNMYRDTTNEYGAAWTSLQ